MKETLKNTDLSLKANLISNILIMVMGILIMIFKTFGLIDIILYISILFYILAFIKVITYFIRRKEDDYETLILALISTIIATFMFIYKSDSVSITLGLGLTIFSVLEIVNRGYRILVLKKEDNFMWTIKFITTFVIGVLGLLTSINFYHETTVQTMMIAYYFITFGLILTIENFIEIFISDKKFKKILAKLIDEDPYKHLDNIKEDRLKQLEEAKKSKRNEKKKTKKVSEKQ